MNTYTITITDNDDKSELSTFEVKAEDIATLTSNLEAAAHYDQTLDLELADGTFLSIDQNSEHGYNADLYASEEAYNNGEDPVGGGLCTGTLSDAIEMAITCR